MEGIDLGRVSPDPHPVAGLVDPSPLGQRPELFGLVRGNDNLDLGTRQTAAGLDGEFRPIGSQPDTDAHSSIFGKVPLAQVHPGPQVDAERCTLEEELALDFGGHDHSLPDPLGPTARRWSPNGGRMHTMASTSYVGDRLEGVELSVAIESLAEHGYERYADRTIRRTRLDTFDGRLHAAGMRLDVFDTAGAPRRLVLAHPGSVPGRTSGSPPAELIGGSIPAFAEDLPRGPFRARVHAVTEMRALLPLAAADLLVTEMCLRHHDERRSTVLLHDAGIIAGTSPGDDLDADLWIAEVIAHPGHANESEATSALLCGLGAVEVSGDVMDLIAMLSGFDPRGMPTTATISLDPLVSALDGIVAVLAHQRRTIAQQWEGVLAQTDTEFLHDLRVALRRTRSILSQAKTVIDPDDRAEYAAGFRWLAAATSSARDLDVLALDWPQRTASLPPATVAALAPVQRHLLAQRSTAHDALATLMRSPEVDELLGSWDLWLADPANAGTAELGPDADAPLGRLVANQIASAHRRVIRDGRNIDAQSPAEALHDLRKDAKQLRYRVECFAGMVPKKRTSAFVRRLKTLQDVLGLHQDAQVHADDVRLAVRELEAVGNLGDDTADAAAELIAQHEHASASARAKFFERFAEFDSDATMRDLERVLGALRP